MSLEVSWGWSNNRSRTDLFSHLAFFASLDTVNSEQGHLSATSAGNLLLGDSEGLELPLSSSIDKLVRHTVFQPASMIREHSLPTQPHLFVSVESFGKLKCGVANCCNTQMGQFRC